MDEKATEERLSLIQDARVHSMGKLLRASFGQENHDTLGSDVTGLMIDLSKLPYGDEQPPAHSPARLTPLAAAPPPAPRPRVTWRARIGMLFGRR